MSTPYPQEWRLALERLIVRCWPHGGSGYEVSCTIGQKTAQKILDALEEVGALKEQR